jgi:hypothetical protein
VIRHRPGVVFRKGERYDDFSKQGWQILGTGLIEPEK